MTSHTRNLGLAAAFAMLATIAPACAQENLDQGKTAQQLFASDCAICHKSPQGLAAKAGGLFGLDGFLREHYTASRQTASLLAKYLQSVGDAPGAEPRRGNSRRTAKPAEKKPSENKTDEAKKSDAKPEAKSEDKSASKGETKSEAKPEQKPEAKSESQPKSEKPAKSE